MDTIPGSVLIFEMAISNQQSAISKDPSVTERLFTDG